MRWNGMSRCWLHMLYIDFTSCKSVVTSRYLPDTLDKHTCKVKVDELSLYSVIQTVSYHTTSNKHAEHEWRPQMIVWIRRRRAQE